MKHLIKHFKIIFLSIFMLTLFGCTTIETLYLQDVEVTGPINQSPIHITDSTQTPSVTFSMRFSYNPEKEMKAKTEGTPKVNEDGFYQVDTIYHDDGTISFKKSNENRYLYRGQNLTWNFASVTAGIDMDIKLSKNFALFAGVNYAGGNNKSLWGGTGGIGLFGVNNGIAFRLDAGFHFQSIAYDAYTIAEIKETSFWGSTYEYVMFYHDIDETTYFDPFVNFTFNTAKKDWVLNIFINGGYSVQSLLDFEPRSIDYDWFFLPPFVVNTTYTNDYRGETTAGFVHLTPGVYFNFAEQGRILIGARFYYETQLEEVSQNLFILPMMQVDFTL
ncbi:MAG: hypothetical protein MUE91_02920 [Ignavibacteriaceae bacterium]|nr:hypothetical protein [Ignavibacteriaceae bacterium]MCU0413345.1 hypothetical protein [Ignavibacteriaceae bacterium]